MIILWEQIVPFIYKNTYENVWTTPWLDERQDTTWYLPLAQEAPAASALTPWVTYAVVAVVAIVIVIVAAFFLMKRRK